jgi:hypothetical protein
VLLPFILGLAMDPDLHEAFLRNPTDVILTRAELSDTEKEMLLSPNRNLLATAVVTAADLNTPAATNTPPPQNTPVSLEIPVPPETIGPPITPAPLNTPPAPTGTPPTLKVPVMTMPMIMPGPGPWVYASQNMTGFYWERKGNTLTLTIHGTRMKGSYVCIEIRNGETRIPGQIGEIHGSHMGETIVVTFTLPDDLADGTYWVVAASEGNQFAPLAAQTTGKPPMTCDFVEIGLGYEVRRSGG